MSKSLSSTDAQLRLEEVGAIRNGHFVGTQGAQPGEGLHMKQYVDKDVIGTHPNLLEYFAITSAHRLIGAGLHAAVVVGLPMGGIGYGTLLARELDARSMYLEKGPTGTLDVRRQPFIDLLREGTIVLAEDVVHQGQTTIQAAQAIQAYGGTVAGVACIWNRGGRTAQQLGVPALIPVVDRQLDAWERDECPMCRDHTPINLHPGHGHHYRNLYGEWAGGYV